MKLKKSQLLALVISLMGNSTFGTNENKSLDDADLSELSLEQLMHIEIPTVVGASKHEQKITDAPSSVSIISARDIKMLGYRTLADILDGVRGFYTTFDGAYDYAGVRGINRPGDYGGRFLINIDGHRLNEPIYDSAFLGYDLPLDIDLIERVEVIRGPGSSLYGNNAFFGVINIVTKKSTDISDRGGEIAGVYGLPNTQNVRITQSHHLDSGVDLIASGTYYHSDGASELVFPGLGTAHYLDATKAISVFGSISYKGLTLQGVFGRRNRQVPSAPYGAIFDDPATSVADDRGFAELRFERSFNKTWEVMTRAYLDYYYYRGTFPYKPNDDKLQRVISLDTATATWWGIEGQVSHTFAEQHRLTLGAEFREDPLRHQWTYDLSPGTETYINANFPSRIIGVYLQGEFSILKNLMLNAGLRYDYFSTSGHTANPRAALIYHPWKITTFKFLFGQAYRAPNSYEFNYTAIGYLPNQDLKPETIRSYEFVWEQAIWKYFRLTNSYFFNDIEKLITQVSTVDINGESASQFQNTDAIRVFGGDLELEADLGNGFRGRLAYTLAWAQDASTGDVLTNSPLHQGKARIFVPIYKENLFIVFELQAMSERKTVPREGINSETMPGFAIGNLTLFSQELVKNLEVSLSVYNLWNQHYSDPVSPDFALLSVPQTGISARGKVIYRF